MGNSIPPTPGIRKMALFLWVAIFLVVIGASKATSNNIIFQDQNVIAPDDTNSGFFGEDVALAETSDGRLTLVVGANYKRVDGIFQVGSVYIYETNKNNRFQFVEQLSQPGQTGRRSNEFGSTVALFEDRLLLVTAIAAVPQSVYLFEKSTSGSKWSHSQTFELPGNCVGCGKFGFDVALTEDIIAISTYDRNTVFVYYRDPESGTYGSEQSLVQPDSGNFGHGIALDDDLLIVGAPLDDERGIRTGAIFVYDKNPTTNRFKDTASIKLMQDPSEFMGQSVALNSKFIVAGSFSAGPIHIFDRATRTYLESLPSPSTGLSGFGSAVAISDDNAIVTGDPYVDTQKADLSGAAYAYAFNATGHPTKWNLVGTLLSDRGEPGDFLGSSIAVSGSTVVAGDKGDRNRHGRSGGATRVFIVPSLLQPPNIPMIPTIVFLYDATTGARIQRLRNHNKISLKKDTLLTVKAMPSDFSLVGSVVFALDDIFYFVDNKKHFYMNGNDKKNLNAVPEFDSTYIDYKVTVMVYSENDGKGTLLDTVDVEFMLI